MTKKKANQNWEQVSIQVGQQVADQLAAWLEEILPLGVVQETQYGDLFPHELDQYQGPIWLHGYYPAENSPDIRARLTALIEKTDPESPIQHIKYSPLINQDWATAWQARYHPMPVGESLVIVPTWLENPFPERIPIWMDPGMAFGSGTHPTTQISLALIEKSLRESTPRKMIDVGCGSGILAIAALKLGVTQAWGADIDPDAIQVSYKNARANGFSTEVTFHEGSIGIFFDQDQAGGSAFLVVANIIAPVLKELFAEGLAQLVSPGGKLILSGILTEQLPGIQTCLAENGFELRETTEQEGWVGLLAENTASG